jgi:DNA-binding NtrC family response regulator
VILAEGRIEASDLPLESGAGAGPAEAAPGEALAASFKARTQSALRQVDQEMIQRALRASRWNKTKTAKMLRIDYKTLYNKLKEYHIE